MKIPQQITLGSISTKYTIKCGSKDKLYETGIRIHNLQEHSTIESLLPFFRTNHYSPGLIVPLK